MGLSFENLAGSIEGARPGRQNQPPIRCHQAWFTGSIKTSRFYSGGPSKPARTGIILIKPDPPVDQIIPAFSHFLEPGDFTIDDGNEWHELTERRTPMAVSGGEDGTHRGPSMSFDNDPCVTYVGHGGAGNFVTMVHNWIEYGDMQLISEAYDVLKLLGGLSNREFVDIFEEWNCGELKAS